MSGNLCVVLFILANTYVPAKQLRPLFEKKRDLSDEFNILLGYHCILNIIAFFAFVVHCYLSYWVNPWLKITTVLMGWLVLGGVIMKFKYSPALKKGVYFLHTQQFSFFILIFALLKGHYFF